MKLPTENSQKWRILKILSDGMSHNGIEWVQMFEFNPRYPASLLKKKDGWKIEKIKSVITRNKFGIITKHYQGYKMSKAHCEKFKKMANLNHEHFFRNLFIGRKKESIS